MQSEYDKNDDELVERYKNENLEITFDSKQANYMIRIIVALIVFALGVFLINTYFIGI